MTLDFTLEKYKKLCETVKRLDCPVMTVRDFLAAGQPKGLRIILRHDVDRRMGAALRMAELEADYDISATYYVRTTRAVFKSAALKRLHQLGHEVGYHYEVLAKANGNMAEAIALFEQELKCFREIVPVETISMHGSPLSPWNNLDLWKTYDVGDYGVLGDAVYGVGCENLHYFTDTGRSWGAGRYNLRDHMVSMELSRRVHTTDDLIKSLQEGQDCSVFISAHPNRWADNHLEWGLGAIFDKLVNKAKVVIQIYRSVGGKQ